MEHFGAGSGQDWRWKYGDNWEEKDDSGFRKSKDEEDDRKKKNS